MSSDVQTLIANIDFPIVISMYLLGKLHLICDIIKELNKDIYMKIK